MMFFVCLKASVLIFNIIEATWRQTEFYLEAAGGPQQPPGTDYEVTLKYALMYVEIYVF